MQAIGIVIGAIGSAVQLSYQAAIARANSAQLKLNAQAASLAGQEDVRDIGVQGRGELGEIRSNQASSGISVGSPSFARGERAFLGRVYHSAVRRQTEANQQYAAYRTQSNIESTNASAASTAIPFVLASGFADAFAQVGSSFVGAASPTSASYLPLPSPNRRPVLGPTRPQLAFPNVRGGNIRVSSPIAY